MLFLGATNSGKTTLLKKLIFCQFEHKMDFILVLSSTNHLSGDFEMFEETERFKVETTNFEKHIKDVCEQQESSILRKGQKKTPQVMIICDDTLGESMMNYKGALDKLATKSRHLNISLVVLIQEMRMCPPVYRHNCRYIFAYSCVNFKALEQFLEEFCPKTVRRTFPKHVAKIYAEPYTFVFCQCFNSNPEERLWVFDPTLKKHTNLLKLCNVDEKIEKPSRKRKKDSDDDVVTKKSKDE